jgi:rhodanese-related sulfurtransferase
LIGQLQAVDLQQWLEDKTRATPLVIDVREPWEFETCHIPGAQLIPMQQIPARLSEIPAAADVVVVCHHGGRSMQVASYLAGAGRSRVYNLSGGVAAWAEQVDPAMPRY